MTATFPSNRAMTRPPSIGAAESATEASSVEGEPRTHEGEAPAGVRAMVMSLGQRRWQERDVGGRPQLKAVAASGCDDDLRPRCGVDVRVGEPGREEHASTRTLDRDVRARRAV